MSGTTISAAGDAEAMGGLLPPDAARKPCGGPFETPLLSCLVMGMDATALRERLFEDEGAASHRDAGARKTFNERVHEQRKSTNLSVTAWEAEGGGEGGGAGLISRRRICFDSPAPAGVPGVATVPIEELQIMRRTVDPEGAGEVCSVVSVVHAGVVPGNDTFYTYLKYDILPAIATDGGGTPPVVAGGCCHLRLSFKVKFHKPCNAILRSLINRGTLQGMQGNTAGVLALLRDEVPAVHVPAEAKRQGAATLPASALSSRGGAGGGADVPVEQVAGTYHTMENSARILNGHATPGGAAPPLAAPGVEDDLAEAAPGADAGAVRLSVVIRKWTSASDGGGGAEDAGAAVGADGALPSLVAVASLHATAVLLLCVRWAVGGVGTA